MCTVFQWLGMAYWILQFSKAIPEVTPLDGLAMFWLFHPVVKTELVSCKYSVLHMQLSVLQSRKFWNHRHHTDTAVKKVGKILPEIKFCLMDKMKIARSLADWDFRKYLAKKIWKEESKALCSLDRLRQDRYSWLFAAGSWSFLTKGN